IADYLDAETQRIDELIAAKRSMLALLEKKRAALVSQAVTKAWTPRPR
ncbi:MAG: restriction endonuclease subunit S, partial [Flavobacteriales bacterium]|nr:restriction endonuclease subunit S [Flavobacteriales bacterium]